MKLPVVLQAVGLAGLTVGAFILWGAGVAVLTGSAGCVVTGTVLERERR